MQHSADGVGQPGFGLADDQSNYLKSSSQSKSRPCVRQTYRRTDLLKKNGWIF